MDETPASAAGGLEYVHVACTQYLTHLHTGHRSATAIDAGRVLPGYTGTIVRDGYRGNAHLTDAVHAWCGAHLLLWANRQASIAEDGRRLINRFADHPALTPAE